MLKKEHKERLHTFIATPDNHSYLLRQKEQPKSVPFTASINRAISHASKLKRNKPSAS